MHTHTTTQHYCGAVCNQYNPSLSFWNINQRNCLQTLLHSSQWVVEAKKRRWRHVCHSLYTVPHLSRCNVNTVFGFFPCSFQLNLTGRRNYRIISHKSWTKAKYTSILDNYQRIHIYFSVIYYIYECINFVLSQQYLIIKKAVKECFVPTFYHIKNDDRGRNLQLHTK